MQSWLNFISSELYKGFSPLINPQMPDEAKQIAKNRLATRFAYLESHPARNAYLMGDTFTCPDAYCFTIMRWTKPLKMDLTAYPHLQAYMQRIEARPAVQAALKAEELI